MDAVKGFIFPGSTEPGQDDGVPWWMKYASKAAGLLGGVAAIFFGLMCSVSISLECMIAGILQVAAGVILIGIEAPFCCMFLEPVKKFAIMVENRPPWQKSILYVTLAIPPLFLCFGFSTLIGSGALAGTGILYGMQTIGKKASNAEMAAAARGNTEPDEKNIMDDSDWQSNP